MKYQMRAIYFLFIGIFMLSSTDLLGSWKQYVRLLKKTYSGLVPYNIPHSSGNPGNVYHYENIEQLYCNKETCFPDVPILPPDEVPAVFLNEISHIEFRIGAEAKDRNVLPQNISGVAGVAITSNTSAFIFPRNPKVFKIEEIKIEERLNRLDISVLQDELLLKKLCESNYFIVSGALQFDGFEFVFNRDTNLDVNLELQLIQSASTSHLNYRKISQKQFSISANTPMFFAYYAYPNNPEEAKRMLTDRLRQKQIKERENNRRTLEIKINSIEASASEIQGLKNMLQSKAIEAGQLQIKISNTRERTNKSNESMSAQSLNDQLQSLESDYSSITDEIYTLNGVITAFEQERSKLDGYRNELANYNLAQASDEKEIGALGNRKYKLLQKVHFIPADLLGEYQ